MTGKPERGLLEALAIFADDGNWSMDYTFMRGDDVGEESDPMYIAQAAIDAYHADRENPE